jgi:hypothetical protein
MLPGRCTGIWLLAPKCMAYRLMQARTLAPDVFIHSTAGSKHRASSGVSDQTMLLSNIVVVVLSDTLRRNASRL